MKKTFFLMSILLLSPSFAAAQISLPEYTSSSELIYLILLPFLGMLMIIWMVLSKFITNKKLSIIISLAASLIILLFGIQSMIVSALSGFVGDTGVTVVFGVLFILGIFLYGKKIGKIPSYASVFKKQKGERGSLVNGLRDKKNEVSKINGEVLNIKKRVEELRQGLTLPGADEASLNKEINSQQSRIADLDKKRTELENQIDAMEEQLRKLGEP